MINYNFHRQQPFYNREGDGGAGIFMLDRFFFMSVENNFFFRHQTFFLYIHEAKKNVQRFFFYTRFTSRYLSTDAQTLQKEMRNLHNNSKKAVYIYINNQACISYKEYM
jgi:hypothetical protein